MGVPKNWWFTKENPIKMDDLLGTQILGSLHMFDKFDNLTVNSRCFGVYASAHDFYHIQVFVLTAPDCLHPEHVFLANQLKYTHVTFFWGWRWELRFGAKLHKNGRSTHVLFFSSRWFRGTKRRCDSWQLRTAGQWAGQRTARSQRGSGLEGT